MGYCISMRKSKFCIKTENKESALQALKKLGNGSNDPRSQGGTWSSGVQEARWFSWMCGVDTLSWKTLEEAMDDWRYPVNVDCEGNVNGIAFSGEKIGQELLAFETIAPFVEAGSYLHMVGEDGEHWRWKFNDNEVCEEQAKVRFKR